MAYRTNTIGFSIPAPELFTKSRLTACLHTPKPASPTARRGGNSRRQLAQRSQLVSTRAPDDPGGTHHASWLRGPLRAASNWLTSSRPWSGNGPPRKNATNPWRFSSTTSSDAPTCVKSTKSSPTPNSPRALQEGSFIPDRHSIFLASSELLDRALQQPRACPQAGYFEPDFPARLAKLPCGLQRSTAPLTASPGRPLVSTALRSASNPFETSRHLTRTGAAK